MNAITGRAELLVGDETRSIACDMNAAAVLFEKYGEHWTLWLLERFAGKPVKLPGGGSGRKMETLGPTDIVGVLYALLATDRSKSKRIESEDLLGECFGLANYSELQMRISRCILVSFGVPGEAFEVAESAAGEPRGSERAAMDGTGIQS